MSHKRARAREIATAALSQGDPLGWFETLYQENLTAGTVIPWADRVPNPHLVGWIQQNSPDLKGKKALKIGCGLGDDAEYLAKLGCEVTAFDISPTAIAACQERFPNSPVRYEVQDLFTSPSSWIAAFDFVLESYTLQVFLPELREKALPLISRFVRKEGILLVICRGRGEMEEIGSMPWPIARTELNGLDRLGLREISFEDYFDQEDPPVRRFRALYERIEG